MATNFTAHEAIEILAKQNDYEKINEIHRRFPFLADFALRVIAKAPTEFTAFTMFLPEYLTANKVNSSMKKYFEGQIAEDTSVEEVKAEEPTPKKENKQETEDNAESSEYNEMSAKELKKILRDRQLEETCREKFGRLNRDNIIKTLVAFDNGEFSYSDDEEEEEAEEASGKYDGIPAMKLFKMCKERGLKVEPKKPAKYYIELLEEDDAKSESNDEDDDWDIDEDDSKTSNKNDEVEDDDDDDWDI